jgi:hypothetical protein
MGWQEDQGRQDEGAELSRNNGTESKINIRRFREEDLGDMDKLMPEGVHPLNKDSFRGLTLVAQNGKGIVAFISAKKMDDGGIFIDWFKPSALFESKAGIGLFQEMMRRIGRKNPPRVVAIISTANLDGAKAMNAAFGEGSYKGTAHVFAVEANTDE